MGNKTNMEKKRRFRIALRQARMKKIKARQQEEKKNRSQRFNVQEPDDVIFDPRYKVPVSRQGKARNVPRHGDDETFKTIDDPGDEGRKVEVQYYRGGLARLAQQGTISDEMLEAGSHFQHHFEIAGYCNFTTIDLSGGGKGSNPAAWAAMQHIENTANSRAIIGDFLRVLGYPRTQVSKAAWWIVGHGVNLEDMAQKKELHELSGCGDRRYWTAMTVAALQIMSMHFQHLYSAKARRREMRSQSSVRPDEYVVKPGVVTRPIKRKC